MTKKPHYSLLVLFFVLSVQAQEHAAGPATVANHVDEAQLNSITLTEQAVTRLGIETFAVLKQQVANTRVVGGIITEPSGNSIQIVSPYDGVVMAPESRPIPHPGSMVTKGEGIIRLSVLPLPQQLQGTLEILQARQVELGIARDRVQRAEQLHKDGAGSLRDLENTRQALADSEAAYKAAEANAALVKNTSGGEVSGISPIVIRAPQDIQIKDIYVSPGQIVSAGKPLVDMISTGVAWVKVPIYAGYQNQYSQEAGAYIQDLGNTDKAEVHAKYISGPLTADPLGTSVDHYYELDNKDRRFRPGQRVSVRLTENSRADRFVVPESAIFRDIYGGAWVYVQKDAGVYARERVELEQIINDVAVLKTAPAEGTLVVTVGVAELAGTEFGVAH